MGEGKRLLEKANEEKAVAVTLPREPHLTVKRCKERSLNSPDCSDGCPEWLRCLVTHRGLVDSVRKAELLDGLVHEGPVASGAAQRDATPDKRRQRSIRAEEPLLPILRAEPEPAGIGHGRPRRGALSTHRDN